MRNAADTANYRALRLNTSNNLELHDGKVVIQPAGNVGIGTTSPDSKQTLQDDSGVNGPLLTVKNQYRSGSTTADYMGGMAFSAWRDISPSKSYTAAIYARNTGYPGTAGNLIFATQTNGGTDPYGVSERMTIDSSGNLLVGTTEIIPSNSSTEEGISLAAGSYGGFLSVSRDGGTAAAFNRMSTDGQILDFRKGGTTVGSIGTNSTANFRIHSSQSGHSGLEFGTAAILPSIEGGLSNGGVDLGIPTQRFKDLYLAGGVYLGGTAAANKLDDYEEGTWTPALITTGGVTTTAITTYGIYTKIGNICHIHAKIAATLSSLPGQTFQISGLPFTSLDASDSYQRAVITIGGDCLNLGGNAIGKAHFRTNGSSLQGVYLNSGSTAYWTYNTMDSSSFELNIHGFYTTT
jgi:hypothetical protein